MHIHLRVCLLLQPVQAQFGRFFGESASPGVPVIVPSRARQPNPAEAAADSAESGNDAWRGYDGCLGDVTDLEMTIVSSLPAPLDITDLTVVLSIMQVGNACTCRPVHSSLSVCPGHCV